MPAHRMRALLAEGKAPKLDGSALNGPCLKQTGSRASATRSSSSFETSPRNLRVRWTFSGRIQRTSPTTGSSRAAPTSALRTSSGGKTATKVRTGSTRGRAVLSNFARAAEGGAVGDEGGGGPGADPVVHVDYREARGAALQHAQDGGGAVSTEAVAGGGRQAYNRRGDEARDHARQRSLHTGGHDQAVGVEAAQLLQRVREAMYAGDTHVVEAPYGGAHLLSNRHCLLQNRQVRGARADGADASARRCGCLRADHDGAAGAPHGHAGEGAPDLRCHLRGGGADYHALA